MNIKIAICDDEEEQLKYLLKLCSNWAIEEKHTVDILPFPSEMHQGVDTCLYKNFEKQVVEISGGEAHKIAMARALYKNAPIIILDEPTSALDPISEYEIYSRFNEIIGNRTAVFISHRLSSCRFCDDIAVFDHGQIIKRGCHEQLVSDTKGKY